MGALFLIASFVEMKFRRGLNLAANPFVYSLALAVYVTTWTFYGSVGLAATSGFLFLATYLGSTLCIILWPLLLRRLVRLKERNRITSIADLIAARYGKSRTLAGLVTFVILIGITPYVGLQFKALTTTALILSGETIESAHLSVDGPIAPVFAILMIVFTIAFGLRRVNPTERHPGMMMVLSIESVVKLVAFLAAGVYVVIHLQDGMGAIFKEAQQKFSDMPFTGHGSGAEFMQWFSHLTLSFSAALLLPRQFHVAVVENSSEKHIATATWLFPLYLLLINFFVFPIAISGLLVGLPAAQGDSFVLTLLSDQKTLSLLIFIGGFSAGTAMIMMETVAISTMVVNHLLLPLFESIRGMHTFRRYILQCRWVVASVFILAGLAYMKLFSREQPLVSIGLISFGAVLQFAPAFFGGLYWRQANKTGALLGIMAGFLTWGYTLALPSIGTTIPGVSGLIEHGMFGLSFLRPGSLFGLDHLDLVTHSVFWSLTVNLGLFCLGSLLFRTSRYDEEIADEFVNAMNGLTVPRATDLPARIEVERKHAQIFTVFRKYFDEETARLLAQTCFRASGIENRSKISILELADLQSEVERTLAATIGTAAAHAAIRGENLVTPEEAKELSTQYASILADMKVSPAELRTRIDYYRERERILSRQAGTFRLLSEVSQRLSASLEYEPTIATVSRVALPGLSECALLYLTEAPLPGEKKKPRWLVAHNDPKLETVIAERFEQNCPEPSDLYHVAHALQNRKPVSAAPDSGSLWGNELFKGMEIGASITLPLIARNAMLGTLSLISSRPSLLRYSDEVAVVEELAYRCAIAIDNARLYRNAQAAIRAREEFVSIASHELRTPLTPLRNQIQLLQRVMSRGELSNYPAEKLKKMLESADRQVDRMSRLVNELLDISRATAGRLQLDVKPCDLCEIVRETTDRFADVLAGAGCKLQIFCPPEPVIGEWDRLRLEEVVTNLLMNAMKYAPEAPIEINVTGEQSKAKLAVRDHGPGIPISEQERIFDRFERVITPKRVGGFGLGLYISREIAQAHGGTLRVSSVPGEGAEFALELPRKAPVRKSVKIVAKGS